MGGAGFAGVTLPDNVGAAPESSAPEVKEEISAATSSGEVTEADKSQELVDLDKLERFRFGGQEASFKDIFGDKRPKTLDELRNSFMMRGDYTRKTQELAESKRADQEARKYADNFDHDLLRVLEDPQKWLPVMRQMYPDRYVKAAEQAVNRMQGSQAGQQPGSIPQQKMELPKEFQEALSDVREWKQAVQEQLTQSTLEQLNSVHERMAVKYPFAHGPTADGLVKDAIERGLKVDKGNLPEVLEKAYKSLHDSIQAQVDARQKTKVEEQVKAGKSSRDIGAGGSPLGHTPKKYKKLEDIKHDVIAGLTSK